jgi:stage V sporulation protein B
MAGVTFLTIFYVLAFALNGAGKVKIPMIISFFGLAMNIILSYFFIKKYALVGAATATSITSFVIMIMILVYTYRYFGYLFKLSSFIKILIASAVMYLASTFFSRGEFVFILWSFILMGLYIFLLFVMREFGAAEIQILKDIISRKKKKGDELVSSESASDTQLE